jgi:hypothetical protein
MFSLRLRMAHGVDAIGAERNNGPRAARTVAIGSAEALWLADCGFVVSWAKSPSANQSRRTGMAKSNMVVAGWYSRRDEWRRSCFTG